MKTLPPSDPKKPWYHDKSERKWTIRQKSIAGLIRLLYRLGFKLDQSVGDPMLAIGWARFYNLTHGDPLPDWQHIKAPRLYSRGTVGLQIDWKNWSEKTTPPTATVRTWRNLRNPDK